MAKTVLLLVSGDGDYGAMCFEQNFDADVVYKEMLAEGVTRKSVFHDDGYGEEEIYVKIFEFGEIDPEFVSFMYDEFVDYDASKAKDFHWVTA
jgi:hypothetical protein